MKYWSKKGVVVDVNWKNQMQKDMDDCLHPEEFVQVDFNKKKEWIWIGILSKIKD